MGSRVVGTRRVGLEQIEIVLAMHPAVVEVSIIQRPTGGTRSLTTAYVVLRRQVASGDLALFVAEHLGQEATIDEFKAVAHLPRSRVRVAHGEHGRGGRNASGHQC